MRKRLNTFLFYFGLVLICGCASQGKNLLVHFEDDNATPETLESKMNWSEPAIVDGSTDEQFRIVKALRYISKYNGERARRLMAIRGLVFVTLFADDADVRSSAESRLLTMLYDPEENEVVIDEIIKVKTDVVLGKFFYKKPITSLFTNQIEYQNIYPDPSDRRDALMFLIDWFEDTDEDHQLKAVDEFNQILSSTSNCLESEDDVCKKDDGEELAEWKKLLGAKISRWINYDCTWDSDEKMSEPVKNALIGLADGNAEYIDRDKIPVCSDMNPRSEDYAVLEQRSIGIPDKFIYLGVNLSDSFSRSVHITNFEFGVGNGDNFGVIFGANIDVDWMEPIREKYVNIQYRTPGKKAAMGFTSIYRIDDLTLTDKSADYDGTIDGKSIYINTKNENEFYLTTVFDLPDFSTQLHLYLGSIYQRLAAQYFIDGPDLSVILEGYVRSPLEDDDRKTDTAANHDKSERAEQASDMQRDIMVGVKWNNLDFLSFLFTGEESRVARKGIINAKLYYSSQKEVFFLGVGHPF